MKILFIFCTLLLSIPSPDLNSGFFSPADIFFKKYVKNGRVDYAAIKKNSGELAVLTEFIAKNNLAKASKEEQLAFWINAYNLTVIRSVVNNYPIHSPMDVKGFFDTQKHTLAGEVLTLNDIENKKIREPFKDARIHFVLVCAAKGCPPLPSFAYHPSKINEQLEMQTKSALNNEYFVRIQNGEKKVLVSEIFKWYAGDFPKDLLRFINQYRTHQIPSNYTVDYYPYDWNLNETK